MPFEVQLFLKVVQMVGILRDAKPQYYYLSKSERVKLPKKTPNESDDSVNNIAKG